MTTAPGIPPAPRAPAFPVVLVLLTCAALPSFAATALLVHAGPYDRSQSPVRLHPRPADSPDTGILVSPGLPPVPFQTDADSLWFLLPELGRNQSRRYTITAANPDAASPGCSIASREDSLELRVHDLPVLTYVQGAGRRPRPEIPLRYQRGGYLHPLTTPAGHRVTDDYPTNHIHHHGVWFSWTRTEFQGRRPDFWNMGDSKGRVDAVAVEDRRAGSVFAGFLATHAFLDLTAPQPVQALRESWAVRAFARSASAPYYLVDLTSDQQCATADPLRLPTYHYGGLAYRGLGEWNGPRQVRYLDSNGVTDRVQANETRARWCWLGGLAGSQTVGVAFLGHPENLRAPQPLRIHPTEPYLCWAPSQLGAFAIEPGTTYRSQYRMVLLDGEPEPAMLERLWTDFAFPPEARLE